MNFIKHIFCIAFAITIVHSFGVEIGDHLTLDERKSIFKGSDGKVPNHTVVPVYHTFSNDKIAQHYVHLKPFGKNLQLFLKPSEGILAGKEMPIWAAHHNEKAPYGIHYQRLPNITSNKIFEDINNLAVISVARSSKDIPLIDGVVRQYRIAPLPDRLINDIAEKRSYPISKLLHEQYPIENHKKDKVFHHIVYEVKQPNGQEIDPPELGERLRRRRHVRKEIPEHYPGQNAHDKDGELDEDEEEDPRVPLPEIAYPEILVVVDYDEAISIGGSLTQIVNYVIMYWHAVDLRFRQFQEPRIRLNIAGIIIGADKQALSYIYTSREKNRVLVDVDLAMTKMSEYFFKEWKFVLEKDYDIVVTMTSLDLCFKRDDYCSPATLGYSYTNGACVARVSQDDSEISFVESVSLMEDNGGFSGIVPSAHEIGHLLGSSHDNPIKNDPACINGFIMHQSYDMTTNNFIWSPCSVQSVKHYFTLKRSECLLNKPKYSKEYRRLLPGQVYSLDDQCMKSTRGKACAIDEEVCLQLQCQIPGSGGQCTITSSAAEGSNCGQDRICINGHCIKRDAVKGYEIDYQEVKPTKPSTK